MSSIALVGAPMALEGGRPRRIHTKTHRRKHGKSAARKSHKKRSRKHRGGSHSPYPYITAGGKRKMIHRRRKHGKSAARKSHKGGNSSFCHDKGCIVAGGSKHKKTHRRKRSGKSAARRSHKKHSRRRHRGGCVFAPCGKDDLSPSPYPDTTGGRRHKISTHRRRKHSKSAARKSHKKRSTQRSRRHRGGAGIMSVINKAVVPFSLYKLQKRMQIMTRKARKHLYKSKR